MEEEGKGESDGLCNFELHCGESLYVLALRASVDFRNDK